MGIHHLREPLEMTLYHVLPEDLSDFIAVYMIHHEDGSCSIVDAGPQVSINRLAGLVDKMQCRLSKVLLTHIHLDHGGGAGDLAGRFPNSRIVVHPRGYKHLADPTRLWEASLQALGPIAEFYDRPLPVPEKMLESPSDGHVLEVGGLRVEILHTPGHASHHMSFWLPSEKILFSGDSAGMFLERQGVFVPSTPPPFHYKQYIESLDRQARLSPTYIAFPHNTMIEAGDFLKQHREQIVAWVEAAVRVFEQSGETASESNREKLFEAVERAVASADDHARMLLEEGDNLVKAIMKSSIQGLVDYVVRIRPREAGR